MKGRKPIPTEILRLNKGKLYDIQADREKNTPKPKKPLKPICPRSFTKEQRKIWNKYAKILKNYNMFTIANQTILEILCFNKAIYDYHREKIGMVRWVWAGIRWAFLTLISLLLLDTPFFAGGPSDGGRR